ncbi:MAG: hypothetical protein R2751_09735 [Bacteroidales bacterium]
MTRLEIETALNKLTREELVALNKAIVKRVKLMDDLKRMAANANFEVHDRVAWRDQEGDYRTGHILRINTKTISVEEDGDPEGIWRIPASHLRKL